MLTLWRRAFGLLLQSEDADELPVSERVELDHFVFFFSDDVKLQEECELIVCVYRLELKLSTWSV